MRFPPPVVWGVVAAAGKGPLFYLSVIHFALLFALRCARGGAESRRARYPPFLQERQPFALKSGLGTKPD